MQFTTVLLLAFTALAAAAPQGGGSAQCRVGQCSVNPMENKCDITTSCINTEPNKQLHCACRAGYKADAPDYDIRTHYRTNFAGQEYRVFVKDGVACNTLCDKWWLGPKSCGEVKVVNGCN